MITKNGGYFIGRNEGERFKGRILIEDGNIYLCSNYLGGNGTNGHKLGYEFSLSLTEQQLRGAYHDVYGVQVVSKAKWDAYVEKVPKRIFGYDFRKNSDGVYSFGCGAVSLTTLQVQDARDHIEEYKNERKEYEAALAEYSIIRKQHTKAQTEFESATARLNASQAKFNETVGVKYPGAHAVYEAVRGRGLNPHSISPERIEKILLPKPRKVAVKKNAKTKAK